MKVWCMAKCVDILIKSQCGFRKGFSSQNYFLYMIVHGSNV